MSKPKDMTVTPEEQTVLLFLGRGPHSLLEVIYALLRYLTATTGKRPTWDEMKTAADKALMGLIEKGRVEYLASHMVYRVSGSEPQEETPDNSSSSPTSKPTARLINGWSGTSLGGARRKR